MSSSTDTGVHKAIIRTGEFAVVAAVAATMVMAGTSIAEAATPAPSVNWGPIAKCESGGNPTAHNKNSSASGLLQFLTSTWLRYGGGEFAPTAAQATPAQQIIVANRAYQANGLADWQASESCWGSQRASIIGGVTKAAPAIAAPLIKPVVKPKAVVPQVPKAGVLDVADTTPVAGSAMAVLDAASLPWGIPGVSDVKAPAVTTPSGYTVVAGDNLSTIATSHGVKWANGAPSWQKIYQQNAQAIGSNPNLIHPGLVLQVG